jgi:hypothetical protein
MTPFSLADHVKEMAISMNQVYAAGLTPPNRPTLVEAVVDELRRQASLGVQAASDRVVLPVAGLSSEIRLDAGVEDGESYYRADVEDVRVERAIMTLVDRGLLAEALAYHSRVSIVAHPPVAYAVATQFSEFVDKVFALWAAAAHLIGVAAGVRLVTQRRIDPQASAVAAATQVLEAQLADAKRMALREDEDHSARYLIEGALERMVKAAMAPGTAGILAAYRRELEGGR